MIVEKYPPQIRVGRSTHNISMIVRTMETTNRPVITTIEPVINLPFAVDFSSSDNLFRLQFKIKLSTTRIVTAVVEDNILAMVFDLLWFHKS